MNLRQYSGSFFWPVIFVIGFSFLTVFMILWLVFAAAAADNNPPCLTKEQARAKWPKDYIYWHGANRCWDNISVKRAHAVASRSAVWGRENSLKLAKPNLDSSGNIVRHSGRPIFVDPPLGPSVAYPTLMAGGGTTDNMLQAGPMTSWPLIMDFDVEPPQFIPWQKRIAAAF